MRRNHVSVNIPLLSIILLLIGLGFAIFLSASVGLIVRQSGADFKDIVFSQAVWGLLPGLLLMYVLSRTSLRTIRGWSFYFILLSIFLTLLVFVPGIGFEHGGASRWISIGSKTFQPSELLKIATLIYLAAWFAMAKQRSSTVRWGLMPLLIILSVVGAVLLSQPDIDTFLVIFVSGMAIYLVAGGHFKHMAVLGVTASVLVLVLAFTFPYVRERLETFVNPSRDSLGSSYQIQQSLIAVGSGGFWGRGFGKSIQKFNYLPEPIGDSVYAVASEEFGFVGSAGLLILFFLLAQQGLRIANRSTDLFGRYLAVGIVCMFIVQAFVNIGAMLGILPISGITLPFVSHGGSALWISLGAAGILLSISRNAHA